MTAKQIPRNLPLSPCVRLPNESSSFTADVKGLRETLDGSRLELITLPFGRVMRYPRLYLKETHPNHHTETQKGSGARKADPKRIHRRHLRPGRTGFPVLLPGEQNQVPLHGRCIASKAVSPLRKTENGRSAGLDAGRLLCRRHAGINSLA